MNYLEYDFQGQKSFKELIDENFPDVFVEVQCQGFHEGWKFLTGLPKQGNYNPNWRDCERYVNKVIDLDLHKKYECPELPFEQGLINRRNQCSVENYWLLMSKFCIAYRELASINKSCKRDGTLVSMFNDGDIGCNLFSDTQAAKVAHISE